MSSDIATASERPRHLHPVHQPSHSATRSRETPNRPDPLPHGKNDGRPRGRIGHHVETNWVAVPPSSMRGELSMPVHLRQLR